jgi:hypothetical protein
MADPRAVIELFTSQGCSSCPPADQLLAKLHADPSLIPLSLPIDYWDYLGWKDTLAIPSHATRQRAYSQVRGDREIYTPQAVVNGVTQVIGSDHDGIENAVAQSHDNASYLPVPVQVKVADEQVSVRLSARERAQAGGGEVWLCALSGSVSVGIARGENRGRTITYTNVVRRWIKLGSWNGENENFTIPVDAIKSDGVDAIAVILQSGSFERPGPILGASLTSLN